MKMVAEILHQVGGVSPFLILHQIGAVLFCVDFQASAFLHQLVAEIEKKVYNNLDEEISTKVIGEYVMEGLKKLDEVAYVRFASVYKQFKDISTFFDFINDFEKILGAKPSKKD